MSESEFDIAVLLACHNRKNHTLAFLKSLFCQSVFNKYAIDIYLMDDASTDGTPEAVKERYPFVNLVSGSGNLFWAGGMRKVWEYAIRQKEYQIFCLFNDDVDLFTDALERLLKNYKAAGKGSIIVGSTLDPDTKTTTYGGNVYKVHPFKKTKEYVIEPHQYQLRPCSFASANILLVDALTVEQIGILSERYTHYFADFDYTHTAYKRGIGVFIAPGYYGYCVHGKRVNWVPQNQSFLERIRYFYHPKGLAYKEQMHFIKKHFPLTYPTMLLKLWMKTLFPVLWEKYKKK